MSDRDAARRELGAAAVVTEAEAVRLLPCRDATARAWLRERGLVRETPLGRVVVWGEVLREIAQQDEAPAEAPRARLARASLR